MENSQTCVHYAMRDEEEDVSKRQDGCEDEEVDDTPEDAGVEEDEDGNEGVDRHEKSVFSQN